MPVSLKTHKRLWGRAASRCSFEGCKTDLFENHFQTDDATTIGDEAHIISGQIGGPRYSAEFASEKTDTYVNLILLCKKHHAIIDGAPADYPTERIIRMKQAHEDWVEKALRPDTRQQKDDELYADYVDQVQTLADFDHWDEWTYSLCGSYYTRLKKVRYNGLLTLYRFLSGRIYPSTRPTLRTAFEQFNIVLEDLLNEFSLFSDDDPHERGYIVVEQLYRLGAITPQKQQEHEYLIEALTQELSKAANRLCEVVRQTIHANYRLEAGILLMKGPPIDGISFLRFEYAEGEAYAGYVVIRRSIENRLKEFSC